MRIDLTIVAGHRPDLLRTTLASFSQHLFSSFDVAQVFANIDPFCGSAEDGDTCEAMIRDRFENVKIFRPGTPSFGAAVQRLWQQPQADIFFHLEDDWIMNENLPPERIAEHLHDRVVQVQLSQLAKKKSPYTYNFPARWRKILGVKVGKVYDLSRPLFTTSPSFVQADFAKRCAAMMDPDLDPEKQLYHGDTALSTFTRDYRSMTLQARDGGPLVVDLGREWLSKRNVEKRIQNGISTWHPTN